MIKSTSSGIIQFKPAENIAEAEEYARNVLGIPSVSYNGVDVTVANEWNRGLKDTFDKFPELKKRFGFVGECHERNKGLEPLVVEYYTNVYIHLYPNVPLSRLQLEINTKVLKAMNKLAIPSKVAGQSFFPVYSGYFPYRGITVNSEFGNDADTFVRELQKITLKFHPIGCTTIRSVLDHEIGHQLDLLLCIRDIPIIQEIYNKRSSRELTDDLSEYAWNNHNKNRYAEMIAEGWSEFCNNPNPREIAKTISKIIEEEYKKKFGKP